MKKLSYAAVALLAGCATADDVQNLKKDVDTLKAEVKKLEEQVKKAPAARSNAPKVDQAAERGAAEALRAITESVNKGEIDKAKAKLTEMGKKYSSTRTWRRAQKVKAELDVFGKEAPKATGDLKWFTPESGAKIDFAKGTTLLVFWEVWCPHCKREVPKVQKTFDKYNGKGLNLVGLTKITRSSSEEKVTDFLKEAKVTYPTAKEDGSLSRHFNVSGIPAAAVVKDGKVVWRGHPARLTDKQIENWIN